MIKRYFTLEEANKLLPMLIKEIDELKFLQQEFESKLTRLEKIKHSMEPETRHDKESIFQKESELDFIEMQLQLHVNNIQSTGAQLKGIETALLDFPAILNNEEVLLCWKEGELEITHYHGFNDGFAGRKPLK